MPKGNSDGIAFLRTPLVKFHDICYNISNIIDRRNFGVYP